MTRTSASTLAPDAIGVKTLKTDELEANPHNPRTLFDKVPMRALERSIEKVGILVPLTVYWDRRRRHYVILDGQRRWMTAQKQQIATVPVNVVAEPTLVQNIVTMFQIHKVREDWELMPTALKLEVLMTELDEKNEANLATLTGLDQAVVSRCKKLLSYPRRYQDMMLEPDPDKRLKADFFIELYAVRNDRFVNSMKWFDKNAFTDRMLIKYLEARTIKSVTDFRTIKQHISNARRAGKTREISVLLRQFAKTPDLSIDHLVIKEADVSAGARKALTSINALYTVIQELDEEQYYGEDQLWKRLEDLSKLIARKLRNVGKRTPA